MKDERSATSTKIVELGKKRETVFRERREIDKEKKESK